MEDKAEHSLAHSDRNQTNPTYHHLSLFVQQVETCLILFVQDNVLTANSNGLFCLFIIRILGLAHNLFIRKIIFLLCNEPLSNKATGQILQQQKQKSKG